MHAPPMQHPRRIVPGPGCELQPTAGPLAVLGGDAWHRLHFRNLGMTEWALVDAVLIAPAETLPFGEVLEPVRMFGFGRFAPRRTSEAPPSMVAPQRQSRQHGEDQQRWRDGPCAIEQRRAGVGGSWWVQCRSHGRPFWFGRL